MSTFCLTLVWITSLTVVSASLQYCCFFFVISQAIDSHAASSICSQVWTVVYTILPWVFSSPTCIISFFMLRRFQQSHFLCWVMTTTIAVGTETWTLTQSKFRSIWEVSLSYFEFYELDIRILHEDGTQQTRQLSRPTTRIWNLRKVDQLVKSMFDDKFASPNFFVSQLNAGAYLQKTMGPPAKMPLNYFLYRV